MSKSNNVNDFLSDIANAIRYVNYDRNEINAQNFSSKIRDFVFPKNAIFFRGETGSTLKINIRGNSSIKFNVSYIQHKYNYQSDFSVFNVALNNESVVIPLMADGGSIHGREGAKFAIFKAYFPDAIESDTGVTGIMRNLPLEESLYVEINDKILIDSDYIREGNIDWWDYMCGFMGVQFNNTIILWALGTYDS